MIKNSRIIKNLVIINIKKEFKSYKWILFILIFFIINLISKISLYKISLSTTDNYFTWWDVLYNIIQNQYYLFYLFIPIMIYMIFKTVNSDINSVYIIRHLNRRNFYISKLLSSIIITFVFILLIILTSLIGSFGISFSPVWSETSKYIFSNNVIDMFNTPVLPIFISVILIILTCVFLENLILLSSLFIKRKFVCIPTVSIWVGSLVGFRISGYGNLYEYSLMNTNVLLHQSLSISKYGIFISLLILIMSNLILTFVSLKRLNSFDFACEVEL